MFVGGGRAGACQDHFSGDKWIAKRSRYGEQRKEASTAGSPAD
jgi:hypothetical protein